jgi:AraC-like DNA-binding protein
VWRSEFPKDNHMIAPVRTTQPQIVGQQHQDQFIAMLPLIRTHAGRAFRRLNAEHRDDLIQEVVASAFCAYASLVRRGKGDTAFATPLANFAIRQTIAGRRVGSRSRLCDAISPFAQSARGIQIERLDVEQGALRAALVEDRRAGPAEIAAARIDVAAWLSAMSIGHRRIAQALAIGETTSEVAKQCGLSSARVSQIRSLLKASWDAFHERGSESREPCVAT